MIACRNKCSSGRVLKSDQVAHDTVQQASPPPLPRASQQPAAGARLPSGTESMPSSAAAATSGGADRHAAALSTVVVPLLTSTTANAT
jgi:hypothetical protein